MKRIAWLLILILLVPAFSIGCNDIPAPLTVVLATPSNGATVNPQTTVLTWVSLGSNTYEVQIAKDASFQSTVVDATNVTNLLYPVSPGTLSDGSTYFWRVRAFRGGQSSAWTTASYFITSGSEPPTPPGMPGTITVHATLDGSAWTGSMNYSISGQGQVAGYVVPQSFTNMQMGIYTLTYNSGGPSGAIMESIHPSSSQTLASTGTVTFTVRFRSPSVGGIQVYAQLDGAPWGGSVNYSISGPTGASGYSVPHTFSNLSPGTYVLTYQGGGPAGASFSGILPSPTEVLSTGGSATFTMNFRSAAVAGSAYISATLNGSPWNGAVNYTVTHYTISGPIEKTGYSVPGTIINMPSGTIQLNYNSGGPSGASLSGISPSAQQTLSPGGTVYYTMNFIQQQAYGSVVINATLDGSPWQTAMGSGAISYSLSGPSSRSGSTIPATFSNEQSGIYTITYETGGPTGATFAGISPATTQTLIPNGTIVFTINFRSQARGTVYINATQNGAPWSGPVNYVVTGPYPESGSHAPNVLSNAPSGNYSVNYSSGGPSGFVFEGVSPPSQYLPAGGSITFTIRFVYRGGLLQ